MCGICGVVDTIGYNRIDKDVIERMTSKLSHRGPDTMQLCIRDNMTFGYMPNL